MAELFSQYASGVQFGAGPIVGSATGASGLNPIVDRLNSISTDNGNVIGSFVGNLISGTSTNIITPYQNGNNWNGSYVSGTNLSVYAKDGNVINQNLSTGSYYSSSWYQIPSTFTQIGGSAVITTTGGPVLIMSSFEHILIGSSTIQELDYKIGRDNSSFSEDLSSAIAQTSSYSLLNNHSIHWLDTPSAGTHYYNLNAKYKNNITGSISSITINAIELKN